MIKQIKLAVVIPTHNRKNELADILDDLDKQSLQNVLLSKYIVVDGSNDGTIEMLRAREGVSVIKGDGNLWYTRSMNFGFKKAIEDKNDFFVTLNDDCRVEADFISSLLDAYHTIGSKCIIGSISFSIEKPQRIIFSGVQKIEWWRYKVRYYIPKDKVVSELPSELKVSRSLPGRGILIPVEVFKEIGTFDNRFIQYYSDSEFVFRCWKNQIPAYISYKAKVFTYLSKTGQGSVHSKESLMKFIKNFNNVYARNYLPNISRIIWMYGIKVLWPLTISLKILGHLKSYILKQE